MKQQNFIIESENQSQIFMGFTEGYLYHAHLRLELMFVFEGNVNVIVENSQYALKQGDILIVNPFERHAYFATDKNTRAFFIMFPNTFTTQISDMLSNKIFSQTAITNPQLFKETSILIQHIIDHYAVKNYLMLQVDAYISGILTALVAILSKNTVMRPFAEKSGELLFTVLKYLHTNFSERLNTGTIAAAFGYSERTIYRYVDAGIFPDVRNIDLVRKVRYRPRRKSGSQAVKVDKKCRIGRTHEDFQAYMAQHPGTAVVQMDTVEGRKGGPCLLTIHSTVAKLMLAFVRERNDSASVIAAFDWIEQAIGPSLFYRLFPVILTDNGSEFSNPRAIEEEPHDRNILRTLVFYCHTGASFEKGACEVNHEFIRRIIPKGSDIPLSQPKISLMMSHINSYAREGLNGRSPYDLFSLIYGEETLQKLGIQRIPAREIILKPELLR